MTYEWTFSDSSAIVSGAQSNSIVLDTTKLAVATTSVSPTASVKACMTNINGCVAKSSLTFPISRVPFEPVVKFTVGFITLS